MTLGHRFDFEAFGFGGQFDCGRQLLLAAHDLLLFDFDLLATLHHRDLHLFTADLLLDLGRLQLVGQLRFGFLTVGRNRSSILMEYDNGVYLIVLKHGVKWRNDPW